VLSDPDRADGFSLKARVPSLVFPFFEN